ncbi:leucine-rich repeat protein [Proteiniclasticum ruminis]|uniref:leucine-rich repeat protein n=1 Tax=Proteiniclasticum ruminis TaxID=398199 RepID=UPI0028ABFFE9|nr:leucine-rich repeat protein [Proteiniclasticum ruminis]
MKSTGSSMVLRKITVLYLMIVVLFVSIPVKNVQAAYSTPEGFEYTLRQGKAWITKYKGPLKNITIPSALYEGSGSIPVEGISSYAFQSNDQIESVIVSEGIKYIAYNAFLHCNNLTTVSLPNSLEVGDSFMFRSCFNLREYIIKEDHPNLELVEGILYTENLEAIVACPPSSGLSILNVPSSVESIMAGAFEYHKTLQIVNFNEKHLNIGDFAFDSCENLTEVNLSQNTELSVYSFYSSPSLTVINVPSDSLYHSSYKGALYSKDLTTLMKYPALSLETTFEVPGTTTTIARYAFENCKNLIKVILPEGMTKVDEFSFQNAISVEEVVLPASILEIGGSAFENCSSLQYITLPSSVKTISSGAFSSCDSLETLQLPEGMEYIGAAAFENSNSLKEITLPSSLRNLGERAFQNCTALSSIHIGANLSAIYQNTFSSTASLTNIIIPGNIKLITDYAFYGAGLRELDLKEGIESIGAYAFSRNQSLEEVILPDSLYHLGTGAFSENPSIRKVKLSNSLTAVPNRAFIYGNAIEEVSIPEGIVSIGERAFSNAKLTELILPSTLTSVGDYSFENTSLKNIYFYGNAPTFGREPFPLKKYYNSYSPIEGVYYKGGTTGWDDVSVFNTHYSSIQLKPFYLVQYLSDLDEENIPNDHMRYLSGQTVVLKRFEASDTHLGKNFIGWENEIDGTNVIYAGNSEYVISNEHPAFRAIWSEEKIHTLSFENYIGNPIPDQYLRPGEYPKEPIIEQREGYRFDGWYADPTFTDVFNFDEILSDSGMIYALWTPLVYQVTFDTTGGKPIAPELYEYMSLIKIPENPEKIGHTLHYWSYGDSFRNQWNFKEDRVTSNITLIAYWLANSYTVSFETNGGDAMNSITTSFGSRLNSPNTPKKAGVQFDGWYVDRDFTQEWNFEEDLVEEDMILYAKWAPLPPSVKYRTHVQNVGWQNYVSDGNKSGTEGQSLRLEGIEILLEGDPELGIKYSTHVQNLGWQDYVSDGEMAGTSGQSLRLEAIKIELTGNKAQFYDVYYRVHAQGFGWLDWARNGMAAGTAGYGYRLEAIEILVLKKGLSAPVNTRISYQSKNDSQSVRYQTHVQNVGWQEYVGDGLTSGTSGRSLRLEGVRIKVGEHLPSGSIEYTTHVQNKGWLPKVSDNAMSGTSGESLRLEAIRINLTGELAQQYDVFYRVHAQNIGWMDWAMNGAAAGTAGYAYRLEAIEIVIHQKGDPVPGDTTRPFIQK